MVQDASAFAFGPIELMQLRIIQATKELPTLPFKLAIEQNHHWLQSIEIPDFEKRSTIEYM